jgi:hypothetical protein
MHNIANRAFSHENNITKKHKHLPKQLAQTLSEVQCSAAVLPFLQIGHKNWREASKSAAHCTLPYTLVLLAASQEEQVKQPYLDHWKYSISKKQQISCSWGAFWGVATGAEGALALPGRGMPCKSLLVDFNGTLSKYIAKCTSLQAGFSCSPYTLPIQSSPMSNGFHG